jgi:hypothetical protein
VTRASTVLIAGLALFAIAAGATYYLGWWGSYEHRLTAAVRHWDCRAIETSHERAGRAMRFTASCEDIGPMATWVRYDSASDMRRGLPALLAEEMPSSTVCLSDLRAEAVMLYDVGRRRSDDLCRAP